MDVCTFLIVFTIQYVPTLKWPQNQTADLMTITYIYDMYVLPLQEEEDICIQKEDIIFDTCQNSRFRLLSSFIIWSIIEMAKSQPSKKAKTTPKKRSKPLVVVADTFTADDAFDLVGCRV